MTRGDLLIRIGNGVQNEINRFHIALDAYADGPSGMLALIREARRQAGEKRAPFTNVLLGMTAESGRITLENRDMEGGYTYLIDFVEGTFTFGYRYGDSGWIATYRIDEFFDEVLAGEKVPSYDHRKMDSAGSAAWEAVFDTLRSLKEQKPLHLFPRTAVEALDEAMDRESKKTG